MSGGQKSLTFFILVILLNSFLFAAKARPLNIMKSPSSAELRVEEFFDRYALGAVKDGPSPGQGHKFTDTQTLGGNKSSGPSPGEGNKFVAGKNQ
ncbi:hypothetical protein LguiB_009301 [Lonicera macranthoides]